MVDRIRSRLSLKKIAHRAFPRPNLSKLDVERAGPDRAAGHQIKKASAWPGLGSLHEEMMDRPTRIDRAAGHQIKNISAWSGRGSLHEEMMDWPTRIGPWQAQASTKHGK